MVEGDGLENRYTPRGYRGFESLALRHFYFKNGERSRKASLHAAAAALHSKGAAFSSHLHKKNEEALLVKTLHFITLVKRSAALPVKFAR